MKTLEFKIIHGDFTATLAVGERVSLYAFAELITEAVGFSFDHCFEFCDDLKRPHKSKTRYTLFADMGEGMPGDISVKKTSVAKAFSQRKKMLFHFDYGDDWFFLVTCVSIKDSGESGTLKKILSTKGEPPIQYPDDEEEEEEEEEEDYDCEEEEEECEESSED